MNPCPRCSGLLILDQYDDGEAKFGFVRCVCCGHRADLQTIRNQVNPPKVDRRGTRGKARFNSPVRR